MEGENHSAKEREENEYAEPTCKVQHRNLPLFCGNATCQGVIITRGGSYKDMYLKQEVEIVKLSCRKNKGSNFLQVTAGNG